MNSLRAILTDSGVTLREAISRKQYAVLLILLGIAYLAVQRLQFLGAKADSRFALHVPLLGIPLVGGVLAILAGARQIPYEIKNRTLYPLLAKPVRRWQIAAGKWMGVFILTGITQILLGAVMAIALRANGIVVGTTYWQQIFLFLIQMSVIAAMAMFLSVLVNYDAAIVLGLILMIAFSGGTFAELEVQAWAQHLTGAARFWTLLPAYVLPRLDFYVNPMTQIVLFDWPARPWIVLIPLVGYGAGWTLIFLFLAAWLFERKDL